MFDLGQSTEMVGPIVLADPTMEHSLVISALLNIIYRYQVPPLSQTAVILYLIDLATKWEMDIVHVVIRRHLEAAFFAQNVHSLGLFTIAIKLQAIDVASKVIELEKTMTDSRPVRRSTHPYLPTQTYDRRGSDSTSASAYVIVDLANITEVERLDFIQLPPKIAWALQRAA